MNTTKKKARIAGLMYLAMAITGPLGIIYIPSEIMDPGDASLTAQNILNAEGLFRLSIFSAFTCQIFFIFLVLALGRLFKGIDEKYEKLMRAFVLVAVPIAFLNELSHLAALHVLSGAEYLKVFVPEQLYAFALGLLQIHQQGLLVVSIFWGLWLFPFGILTIRSGFIPKIFGILLVINCFAYLLDSSIALLFPQHHELAAKILLLPISAGELSIIFWLLYKGAREISPDRTSATTQT